VQVGSILGGQLAAVSSSAANDGEYKVADALEVEHKLQAGQELVDSLRSRRSEFSGNPLINVSIDLVQLGLAFFDGNERQGRRMRQSFGDVRDRVARNQAGMRAEAQQVGFATQVGRAIQWFRRRWLRCLLDSDGALHGCRDATFGRSAHSRFLLHQYSYRFVNGSNLSRNLVSERPSNWNSRKFAAKLRAGFARAIKVQRAGLAVLNKLKCAPFVLLLALPALLLQAQAPVSASDTHLVGKYLDQAVLRAEPLRCDIKPFDPFLDFAFRFDVGYIVLCPLKEFGGNESTVLAFVRVTPEGGSSIVLGDVYKLNAISDKMRARTDIGKLKQKMELSGGFAVGEGRYLVEVLVVDKGTLRMCRRRWTVSIARKRKERQIPLRVSEHTVVPITFLPWKGQFDTSGRGLRLTVLLNAAPIYPFSTRLHAWDRSFLLSTLSSVIAQVDCQSVRLVAFNLEQQKEIYREDHFDESGFDKLAQAMRSLELAAISYQTLQNREGPLDVLARLANLERTETHPSDLAIFLGPQSRFYQKIHPVFLQPATEGNPQFFYLEYVPPWVRGAEFPDSVEYVTKALAGTSYKIHSPAELAHALEKIVAQIAKEEKKPVASGGR